MRETTKTTFTCQAIRHSILASAMILTVLGAWAAPIPSDETLVAPYQTVHWSQKIMVQDDAGVLSGMQNDIQSWEAREKYAQDWNLKSTGIYATPQQVERQAYMMKNGLRYLDKRITGEVNNAEEGTAMAQVGKAQRALTPSAAVGVSRNVKIKFKARVLQQQAKVIVDNPYVDTNATVDATGKAEAYVGRTISSVGLTTSVTYRVTQGVWVASVDKKLTDTISTRVSSEQTEKDMAFTPASNRILEVTYSLPF